MISFLPQVYGQYGSPRVYYTTLPAMAAVLLALFGATVVFFQPVHAHRPHDIIAALATDDSGTIVLAVTRKRLYQSVNSGLTWSLAGGGLGAFGALEGGTCVKEFTNPALSIRFAPSTAGGDKVVFILDAHSYVQRLFVSYDAGLSFFLKPAKIVDSLTGTAHHWGDRAKRQFTGPVVSSKQTGDDNAVLVAGSTCVHGVRKMPTCCVVRAACAYTPAGALATLAQLHSAEHISDRTFPLYHLSAVWTKL